MVYTMPGQRKPFIKNVFTLNECAHIVGAHVLCFADERAMLDKWRQFVVEVDPDVIIGYNIANFDFPYLLDRAEHLKIGTFPYLGRMQRKLQWFVVIEYNYNTLFPLGIKTEMKNTTFSSKAYGTRENKAISEFDQVMRWDDDNEPAFNTLRADLDGRIQFDMLQVMQRDYKLRSYTLNSVCAQFLGEQKEDVHHSIITELQNGNAETRRRLALYCLKVCFMVIFHFMSAVPELASKLGRSAPAEINGQAYELYQLYWNVACDWRAIQLSPGAWSADQGRVSVVSQGVWREFCNSSAEEWKLVWF